MSVLRDNEWADRSIDRPKWEDDDESISHVNIGDDGTLVLQSHASEVVGGVDFPETVIVPPESLAAVMALANAALPDGHPSKFTRSEAMLILGTPLHPGCTPELSERMDSIAQKLLTILPNE
jgi:hypothetical protein